MKLIPLGDKVIIKQLAAEETTKSGILLPSQSQEKPQEAEVIAVGPGGNIDGKEVTMMVKEGDRVLVIDDLLATGGTAVAACNLVKKVGAEVVAAAFIIELDPLKGREKIEAKGVNVVSMLNYDLD